MSWEQALSEIESHELASNLNVVSGMRSFFGVVAKEPVVLELYRHMCELGDAREGVLGRIHDLSYRGVDRRYENPHDTPLAILLWLTQFGAPDYVGMAADLVDRAPQCWYAKKLARRILVPPPVGSGNSWAEDPASTHESAVVQSGDVTLTENPATGGVSRFYHRRANAVATTTGNAGPRGTTVQSSAANLLAG